MATTHHMRNRARQPEPPACLLRLRGTSAALGTRPGPQGPLPPEVLAQIPRGAQPVPTPCCGQGCTPCSPSGSRVGAARREASWGLVREGPNFPTSTH